MEKDDAGNAMEVYIRFNDDMEKDYCFQVTSAKTFKDLLKIFTTLPIALKPNVFYSAVPKGFVVLTAPGYLTEDGALLFSYETDKPQYRRRVALSDYVTKHCWPGQLILPEWEFHLFAFYSFVSFLVAWLYTDLPDFVSPTPGICLTNQTSRVASYIAIKWGYERLARMVIDDVQTPANIGAQIIFFIFHTIKVLVIFFVFHSGMFNPSRSFRFTRKEPVEITKDLLIELGWTGSKRAIPDEYKEFYRSYKIKEHGGMVPAHQAGLFTKLKNLGVFLGNGEGFNTPLSADTRISDISEKQFPLSYEYFIKLGAYFEEYIKDKPEAEINEAIKNFRRYGLLESSEAILALVAKRKVEGDVSQAALEKDESGKQRKKD